MKAFTLAQWVDYIQSLHSRSIDLTLDRVEAVFKRLSIDFDDSLIITLGGTNGKGSSQAMLESIYRHQGCQTASYSSPHLVDYNERIKINNTPVSDDVICQAFSEIEQVRGDITLTYFEYGTLAAFWIFSNAQKLGLVEHFIDVILLETGMGGRKDAVNVVRPDAVLITNIGLDHVQWLGNDRESIGFEKAGLFKQGVIAVCNDSEPPASVINEAKKVGAPLYLVHNDYHFTVNDELDAWQWHFHPNPSSEKNSSEKNSSEKNSSEKNISDTHHLVEHSNQIMDIPTPNITGQCQIQNASAVLAVVHLLSNQLSVSDESIKQGLANVELAGRLQTMTYANKKLLLDVAHNADSFLQLQHYLMNNPIKGGTKAVFGMLSDKDIQSSLEKVMTHVDQWFLSSIAGERSGDAGALAGIIENNDEGANVQLYDNATDAFCHALEECTEEDRLIVMGSFHIVGDVLKYIRGNLSG